MKVNFFRPLNITENNNKPKFANFQEEISDIQTDIQTGKLSSSAIGRLVTLNKQFYASKYPLWLDLNFHRFTKIVNNLNPKILNEFIVRVTKENVDDKKMLAFCLNNISFENLIKAINNRYLNNPYVDLNTLKKEITKIHDAFIENNGVQKTKSITKNVSFSTKVSNLFFTFWQTFMKANDFSVLEPPSSRFEAQHSLQIFFSFIGMIIAFGSYIFTSLVNLSPFLWLPYIATGMIFLSIYFVIGLIEKLFQPKVLANDYINLTDEAKRGNLESVVGRQLQIDEIAASLGKLDSNSLNVIITGDSGTGKSALFKGFVKAVAEGKYPDLIGKQIFQISASDLLEKGSNWGSYKSRLQMLSEEIKGKEDKIILFLEEVHTITKSIAESQQKDLGEQLKVFMETVHVVAATTEEEYYQSIHNNIALNGRFKRIHLKPLSNEEILEVLKDHVKKHVPYLNIPDEELNTIIKLTNTSWIKKIFGDNVEQPKLAKEFLKDVISNILQNRSLAKISLVDKQNAYRKELDNLKESKSLSIFENSTRKRLSKIKTLESELQTLNDLVKNQDILFSKLHKKRKDNYELKRKYFDLTNQLNSLNLKDEKFKKLAKEFLFLSGYFLKISQDNLIDEENKLQNDGMLVKADKKLYNIIQKSRPSNFSKYEISRQQKNFFELIGKIGATANFILLYKAFSPTK